MLHTFLFGTARPNHNKLCEENIFYNLSQFYETFKKKKMWARREFTQQYHFICYPFFQQYLDESGPNGSAVKIPENKCTWVISLVVRGRESFARVNLWRTEEGEMVGWEIRCCNVSSGRGIALGSFSNLFICCNPLARFAKARWWSLAWSRGEPNAKQKRKSQEVTKQCNAVLITSHSFSLSGHECKTTIELERREIKLCWNKLLVYLHTFSFCLLMFCTVLQL